MKTDIEIAQQADLVPVKELASSIGLNEDCLEFYGNYKAKVNTKELRDKKRRGKLILVTAINPTPAGEGKTTTSVGLADALTCLGKKTILTLREPSLGPVFGVKGGAAGGGYAQVVPMEDINLHFTGDFHAIEAANNLLSAMIDNHIQQGNALNIDVRRVMWKRCMDMNDRQLRSVVCGLNGKSNGVPREDGFDITAASEVMAVLCLASDLMDLKARLGRMLVAYGTDNRPIYCSDLNAQGAMTALLRDAIRPNLVQTLEHTPTLIHGGPFANIAHGCNSVVATDTALKLGDYVVTEAGFGADLGAEKFLDIKCRAAGFVPGAVVLVVTVRALKMHGGCPKDTLKEENLAALKNGLPHLLKHIDNLTNVYGLPVVVAINKFETDTELEIETIRKACVRLDVQVALSDAWRCGGIGSLNLAEKVLGLLETNHEEFSFAYPADCSIKNKILAVATKIYGAIGVDYTSDADKEISNLTNLGYGNLPVCIAKTQYSFSDDATKIGVPSDFTIHVKRIKVSAGAGFIVIFTGEVLTMPGLPKVPAAENIDVDENGKITGLF